MVVPQINKYKVKSWPVPFFQEADMLKQQERNEISLYKYVALQRTQNLAENVTSKRQTF